VFEYVNGQSVSCFVCSRRVRVLTRHPILCGIGYGLIAYIAFE